MFYAQSAGTKREGVGGGDGGGMGGGGIYKKIGYAQALPSGEREKFIFIF